MTPKDIQYEFRDIDLLGLLAIQKELKTMLTSEVWGYIKLSMRDTIASLASGLAAPSNDLRMEDYKRGQIQGIYLAQSLIDALKTQLQEAITERTREHETRLPDTNQLDMSLEGASP